MVRHPRRRGELERRAPALVQRETDKTDESEIPCRVRHHLPHAEATPHVNPAHNGEPLTGFEMKRRGGMPWEALCLFGGMAP